jgi:hypothetical protein
MVYSLALFHYAFVEAFANSIVGINSATRLGVQVKKTSALGLVEQVSSIIHTSKEDVIFSLERCHGKLGAEQPACPVRESRTAIRFPLSA